MITYSQLIDNVFACRLCPKSYGFKSRTPDGPYSKFPAIIGKTNKAKLLFVGINPRISNSNRSDHDFWMRDKFNFQSLSANKHRGKSYIEQELHYRFHVRLVKNIFGPDCNFESVAAVTEIFLCATEDSSGLPYPGSCCADLYFGDTLRLANPQVIVAVGSRVMAYFKMQSPNKDWTWNQTGLKFENRVIPVVDMLHPADRTRTEDEKNEGLTEIARQVQEIMRLR